MEVEVEGVEPLGRGFPRRRAIVQPLRGVRTQGGSPRRCEQTQVAFGKPSLDLAGDIERRLTVPDFFWPVGGRDG